MHCKKNVDKLKKSCIQVVRLTYLYLSNNYYKHSVTLYLNPNLDFTAARPVLRSPWQVIFGSIIIMIQPKKPCRHAKSALRASVLFY